MTYLVGMRNNEATPTNPDTYCDSCGSPAVIDGLCSACSNYLDRSYLRLMERIRESRILCLELVQDEELDPMPTETLREKNIARIRSLAKRTVTLSRRANIIR